jgi:putative membrane protein
MIEAWSGVSAWDLAAIAALILIGLAYAAGRARMADAAARRTRFAPAAFWLGWGAIVGAILPPLDGLASQRFAAHMLQHELLMLVGAPLFVVGQAVPTAILGLPGRWRGGAAALLHQQTIGGPWRLATAPVVAWALHGAAVWVWHVPHLYEAAVRSEAVHALQHATFTGTAVLFWTGLIRGQHGRAGYGASVFYVFTTLVHTGLLGAAFTIAPGPFYPLYAERAPDPVADQQVAGLVMWVPAGIVLTLTGLALFAAWLGDGERRRTGAPASARRFADGQPAARASAGGERMVARRSNLAS